MAKSRKFSSTERDQWLAKWRASGLSGAKFAARQGLNPSTLYRWIELFGSETPAASGPASQAASPLFTEIRVRGAGAVEPALIEIALPGGRIVRVRGQVDVAQLRAVLETVASC